MSEIEMDLTVKKKKKKAKMPKCLQVKVDILTG